MIEVGSGVSLFTGKPFCTVRWGAETGQLTPEEMRQHGLACIATAEAAERDAALMGFLVAGGMSRQEAVNVLIGVRMHRGEEED